MTAFAEFAINRAFGLMVNDLRVSALRTKQSVVRRVPVSDVIATAVRLAAGQAGHAPAEIAESVDEDEDVELEDCEPPALENADLHAAVLSLASRWQARVEGNTVVFTVDVPERVARGERVQREAAREDREEDTADHRQTARYADASVTLPARMKGTP